MMIDIQEITVLNDIRERLAQIGDEEIATCERRLTPHKSGEEELGVIAVKSTRAIWVLAHILGNEKAIAMAQSKMANSQELANSLMQQATILDELQDVALEIFWAQAKTDLGRWKADDRISLRKGWMLIHTPEPTNPLAKLLGIG